MDLLELAKQFGLPLALLVVAVVVLWRALGGAQKDRIQFLLKENERLRLFQDAHIELLYSLALKKLEAYVRKSTRELHAHAKAK